MFTDTFPKNKGGISKLHIVSENKKGRLIRPNYMTTHIIYLENVPIVELHLNVLSQKTKKLYNTHLDKVGWSRAMGYNTAPNTNGNAAPIGISASNLESR